MSLESGLTADIPEFETLARYLFQSDDFTKSPVRVKPRAFMPSSNSEKSRWETSVTRSIGLSSIAIHFIGQEVAAARPTNYYGYATVLQSDCANAELIALSDEPPHRHAVITGWSIESDKELRKAANQSRAQVLANNAAMTAVESR